MSPDTKIESATISCPGYVGVTLGSGVNRFNGLFGLVADALVSARVVVADGRVVTASRTENSDLFWGLRGAGANLGVVTSATFQAHKLVNQGQILNADFILPANQSKQYFDFLGSLSGKMPANLAVDSLVVYDPVSKGVSQQPIISPLFSTDNHAKGTAPRELGVHRTQG